MRNRGGWPNLLPARQRCQQLFWAPAARLRQGSGRAWTRPPRAFREEAPGFLYERVRVRNFSLLIARIGPEGGRARRVRALTELRVRRAGRGGRKGLAAGGGLVTRTTCSGHVGHVDGSMSRLVRQRCLPYPEARF